MRLIDADTLLQELNSFSMQITGANAMARTVMGETKKSIAKMIEEQPTAYDVDKVVEQLDEKSNDVLSNVFAYEDDDHLGIFNNGLSEGYEKAIEIVKAGGVNE